MSQFFIYLWIALGSVLAALAIETFLLPNRLFDGGIIGVAMIFANIFGSKYLTLFSILFNLPFVYLAWRFIGKTFVFHMMFALVIFSGTLAVIHQYIPWRFEGETLEIVVVGGAMLGIGIGLIIRYGGCLDGTEILGIILNRKTGFTVGQVVLFCNFFVFAAVGLVLNDWHPALLSIINYFVVIKVMDTVIIGLDETKSVLIISQKSKAIADAIIHELGLGLTIMYGRGGYSGDEREILYVIAERLQLADLKELVWREDPAAFVAIENLHEVSNGNASNGAKKKKTRIQSLVANLLGGSAE